MYGGTPRNDKGPEVALRPPRGGKGGVGMTLHLWVPGGYSVTITATEDSLEIKLEPP